MFFLSPISFSPHFIPLNYALTPAISTDHFVFFPRPSNWSYLISAWILMKVGTLDMNLDHYEYRVSKNFLEYLFCSEGSKKSADKINDASVSNNNDTERILFTIAAIILDFIHRYPDAIIYAKGSTAARTRLYQIKINKYWQIIQDIFELYGYLEHEGFTPFKLNKNYSAFVARKKMTEFMISRFVMPSKKDIKTTNTRGKIDPHMKGHKDHPFFVKKAEESRKVIEKYGLPKEWVKEKK